MASRVIEAAIHDREEIQGWAGVVDNGVRLAFVGLFLFILYRYLRGFIYPCLTPFELDQALKVLDDVYPTAKNGEADVHEWSIIANECLELKIEASLIREKSLQGSLWKTYLGFHPQLMFDVARCYAKSERLECRILTAREKDLQSHLGAEQYRRQIATNPSPRIEAFTTAYESPFRFQSEDYHSPGSPRPYSVD